MCERPTALAIADVLAIAALTAAVMLTAGGTLWKTLAVTAVAYHVLARIVASMPRIDRLAGQTREAIAEPQVEAIAGEEEAPVSGTASTVA